MTATVTEHKYLRTVTPFQIKLEAPAEFTAAVIPQARPTKPEQRANHPSMP